MFRLFNAQAANGNSAVFSIKRDVPAEGVQMELYVLGTLGGGTVVLQASPDGGTTWQTITSAITTVGRTLITVCSQCPLRLNLSGATSPSVNAWITNTGNV